MKLYGLDNRARLTGRSETAKFDSFSYGVGDRGVSIRIPTQVNKDKKGYLEDRRPASNVDPYIASALLCSTTLLKGEGRFDLVAHYDKWLKEIGKHGN